MAAREQHVQQTRPDQTQHNIARQQDQERVLDHSRIRSNENAEPSENRVDDRAKKQEESKRKPRKSPPPVEDQDDEGVKPQPRIGGAQLIDITI